MKPESGSSDADEQMAAASPTWVRVCGTEDVGPGEMKPFDVAGFPPLAIYNLDNTFHATSNVCTHEVALLTDGYFDDDIVECPLHGGAFNMRTGEPVQYPCVKRLAVFPVTVSPRRRSRRRGLTAVTATVTVEARGGQGAPFASHADDTILAAGLRARVGMPYECNSGSCGTCLFQLVEGDVADLWPSAPGIDEAGRAQGYRLACQAVATGDCRIKLRTRPEFVPVHVPRKTRVRLVERVQLTADMAEFRFKGDRAADFLPGQFAMLRLPGMASPRAYSMCNLPNDQAIWSFIVKRVPGGEATAHLFDTLRPGDAIALDGPYGMAWLRTEPARDVVCIGGGSGLSPMLSIARAAVRDPALDGRAIRFFYGGRTVDDMCVSRIVAAEPILAERVELVMAISDGDAEACSGWTGERGFIHQVVGRRLGPDREDSDYYFCGPLAMTDAVNKLLMLEHRIPAKQLHFDRFY